MLKMFTTQLTGLFSRVSGKNEFEYEVAARLLAQVLAGDGAVYVKGFGEMAAVELEATVGAEPWPGAKVLDDVDTLNSVDRVLVVSRFAHDPAAMILAKKLVAANIPFVTIAEVERERKDEEGLHTLADSFLHTGVGKAMLPKEDGTRMGFPSALAALYSYHQLYFVYMEFAEELFEEEE